MNLVLAVVYLSYELELCSEEKEVATCVLLSFYFVLEKNSKTKFTLELNGIYPGPTRINSDKRHGPKSSDST